MTDYEVPKVWKWEDEKDERGATAQMPEAVSSKNYL